MKLYILKNELGSWWVVANDPTAAETKLMSLLDKNDYGFPERRTVTEIQYITTEAAQDVKVLNLQHKRLIL